MVSCILPVRPRTLDRHFDAMVRAKNSRLQRHAVQAVSSAAWWGPRVDCRFQSVHSTTAFDLRYYYQSSPHPPSLDPHSLQAFISPSHHPTAAAPSPMATTPSNSPSTCPPALFAQTFRRLKWAASCGVMEATASPYLFTTSPSLVNLPSVSLGHAAARFLTRRTSPLPSLLLRQSSRGPLQHEQRRRPTSLISAQ